jgi:archaellum component FlaC
MGRLSDLFEHHRENVEEGVKKALGRADETLEALRKRIEVVEAKVKDLTGEQPQPMQEAPQTDSGVVTSDQTGKTTESVKQSRSKK